MEVGGRTAGLGGCGPWRGGVVAAGKGRDGLAIEATLAKAKELGPTDAETGGGLGGVKGTGVDVVEGVMDEVLGQAVADLALFFMGTFKGRASPQSGGRRTSCLADGAIPTNIAAPLHVE